MPTPPQASLNPLDPLSQAQTIIRIMLAGEALAALLALSQSARADLLAYFGLASFTIQWVALASLAMLYLTRRRLRRASPARIAAAALTALLCSTWLVTTLAWLVLRNTWLSPTEGWLLFATKISTLALLVGLLALIAFQSHWRLRQLAIRAKQAELDALQARIHPHFLFNTLNTGVALVHQQPEKAEQLLLDLADLFRAALAGPGRIPLREEVELARRYAEIEQLRFGPRMRLEWELPEPLPGLQVPTLSIQPLVENAIHHGVEPSTTSCLLHVTVDQQADRARITVINDLPASPASARPGHGVGLRAVRERVQAMGGQVETRSEGNCYVATMTLPCPPRASSGR